MTRNPDEDLFGTEAPRGFLPLVILLWTAVAATLGSGLFFLIRGAQ